MNKFIALIFTTILLVVSSLAHAATAWRTTYFEVFMGSPYATKDVFYDAQLAIGMDPDTRGSYCGWDNQNQCEQVARGLENFLHEFAVELQDQGFADPASNGNLDSIRLDDSGREVIRVYLFDFGTNGYPADKLGFFRGCDGSNIRRVLDLNYVETVKNFKITDKGYQNAAHEFFHAVQFASDFRKGSLGCNIGQWITEGTADAVGFDYAKKLRGIKFSSWTGDVRAKPWGIRIYSEPLNKIWTGGDTGGYQTMSFWRHLAELEFARKRGLDHPGSVYGGINADTDYSYLVKLFSTRQSAPGKANELKWLDSWMKSYQSMQAGLAPIYAQFTATFAGLTATRLAGVVNTNTWPDIVFGECVDVQVGDRGPPAIHMIRLRQAAVRCVRLTAAGAGTRPVEVVIQNNDVSSKEQQQIFIGSEGGLLVGKAEISKPDASAPGSEQGKSYAWWRVLVTPGIPQVFTISNMAKSAQNTIATSPILHFSFPKWDSSMTPESTSGGGQAGGKIKTPKAVAERQKSLLLNPTTQSSMAAMSGSDFKPAPPSCKTENRARNLCGPQVMVNLSKDFGGIPGQGPMGSTGGLLKQTGALQAQSDIAREGDEISFLTQMRQLANDNRGNNITLSLPVFQYGFNGSISNAVIEVSNRVVDGIADTLLSIAPQADSDGVYPPNGTVIITEYTPSVLRGTFEASLVSQAEMRKLQTTGTSPPILPVADAISGSFTVSAPWRGNGARPDMDPDGALMTGLRNDMMDFLMKVPAAMRRSIAGAQLEELCQLEFTDQQLQILGVGGSCGNSGGSGAVTGLACNCDCGSWQQVQQLPGCKAECEPKWKIRQCGPYLQTGLGKLDAETMRYQAELGRLDFSENEINGMVYGFKVATPELRKSIWKELEQYKLQQATSSLPEQLAKIKAEQDKRGKNYDAETLRYGAALEQAGYSPTEVASLTEIFAPAPETMRKVFWDAVNAKP